MDGSILHQDRLEVIHKLLFTCLGYFSAAVTIPAPLVLLEAPPCTYKQQRYCMGEMERLSKICMSETDKLSL